jgi:hypothetical protein
MIELAVLLSALIVSSAYSASSNSVSSIHAGGSIVYGPTLYTYTVFANSSGYYARNINGAVVFSSINANDIMSDIFGSSWGGGCVLFQSGLYVLNPVILDLTNTVIDGQGDGSILQLAPGSSALSHPRLLEVLDSHNVTIENIHLDGNLAYNNISDNVVMGLDLVDSWNVTVQNCYVTNWRVFGIYVTASTSTSGVYDITICNNRIINCLWNGISLYSMVSGAQLHDVMVEGNYVEGSGDIGLDVFAGVQASRPYNNTFINNTINGFLIYPGYGSSGTSATACGVRLEAGNNQLVENNTIYNVMSGVADSIVQGGTGNNTFNDNRIWINGSSTWAGVGLFDQYNMVSNNTIYGFQAYNVGVDVRGSNNIIENNTIISNTKNFEGVAENSQTNPNNTRIVYNNLSLCNTGEPIVLASGTGRIMYGNILP